MMCESAGVFSIAGKTVLVTGGANGLGQAYCPAFQRSGANVVVADVDVDAGESFVAELSGPSADDRPQAVFAHVVVTKRESVQALVSAALDSFGRVDVLINNAGQWKFNAAETIADEDWRATIGLNLNGTMLCWQTVMPHMRDSGGGVIINVSSVSSLVINPPEHSYLDTAYFASKAAVNHLTRSLAVQWAKYGIRVNAISPGYMDKGWFDPNGPRPAWLDRIPLDRPGLPEELAHVAVFLASDASSYMTGQIIQVDGGYTLT